MQTVQFICLQWTVLSMVPFLLDTKQALPLMPWIQATPFDEPPTTSGTNKTVDVPYGLNFSLTCVSYNTHDTDLHWSRKHGEKPIPRGRECNTTKDDVCQDLSNMFDLRLQFYRISLSSVNTYLCANDYRSDVLSSDKVPKIARTVQVNLRVYSIPDVPPINSTESTPNFLYNYSNVDLQPQEAFLNVPCSFVYKLSSDMWSNVTAMWRRENGGMISSNRSDQLHQILGQGQANLSISVSALKNYEGPYKCIATSKYYNHSVLLKRAKIVFSPLATTSPDVNSTFGKINTVPVKITSDNPADPVSTEIIVSLALVVSVLVCFTVITSVWLFVKCRRRLAWEVCESIEDSAAGKFSLLNGQKSEVQIPENLQILRKNIRIQKTIGEGYFGLVMEGEVFGTDNCNQWKQAAVKISKEHVEGSSSLLDETVVMAKIGLHKNIIRMLGFCIHKGSILLAMEYAEHGDLRSHLLSKRTRPGQAASLGCTHSCPPQEAFVYGLQVANGMAYMASQQCIHRDLSARNVLVCSGGILKVSDFGLSKDIHCHEYYKRTKPGLVPLKWTAPEALIDKKWSFGVLLWEIATMGGLPYPGIPIEKLYDLLTRSSYRMACPPNCSDKLYSLMLRCWNGTPSKRPNFSALVGFLKDGLTQLESPETSQDDLE